MNSSTVGESPTDTPQPTKAEISSDPSWPDLAQDHPLSKFQAELPNIISEAGYNEVYGVTLEPADSFHSKLIMQKFLRANVNDLNKAKEQLLATLRWRKEFQPLKTKGETFSQKCFGGLGYVTVLEGVPESINKQDVATFNIYGAVKDPKGTFEDLEVYGLQELRRLHARQSAGGLWTRPIAPSDASRNYLDKQSYHSILSQRGLEEIFHCIVQTNTSNAEASSRLPVCRL